MTISPRVPLPWSIITRKTIATQLSRPQDEHNTPVLFRLDAWHSQNVSTAIYIYVSDNKNTNAIYVRYS